MPRGASPRREHRDKRNPDRHLPINRYGHLGVREVASKLDQLSPGEIREIQDFEKHHKKRKTLLEEIQKKL